MDILTLTALAANKPRYPTRFWLTKPFTFKLECAECALGYLRQPMYPEEMTEILNDTVVSEEFEGDRCETYHCLLSLGEWPWTC